MDDIGAAQLAGSDSGEPDSRGDSGEREGPDDGRGEADDHGGTAGEGWWEGTNGGERFKTPHDSAWLNSYLPEHL